VRYLNPRLRLLKLSNWIGLAAPGYVIPVRSADQRIVQTTTYGPPSRRLVAEYRTVPSNNG
jgi:hypothetical protein